MQPDPTQIPFDADLRILAIGPERVPWLAALIETARNDLQPRNFAERHLVDEMAINKWRLLRIYGMEKAVYEHQLATLTTTPAPTQPNADLYHLARALAPDHDSVILAALSRLETRFHRQWNTALKMLISLRRFHPVYLTTPTRKEHLNQPCHDPSKTPSAPATTKSPNRSKPDSSQ